jgi:GxxExxY protein
MEETAAEAHASSVIGAAIEVHKALRAGYTENVYEEALCIELDARNVPFERQVTFPVLYRQQKVGVGRIDILVGDILIVELKAIDQLNPVHIAQVVSYLKMTGNRLGLLLNFNVTHLKHGIRRIIR